MIFHHRYFFGDQFVNISQADLFFIIAKRNGNPTGAGPACTTYAVHISFRYIRKIKVDNMGQVININSTGCYIRSNKYPGAFRFETMQSFLSFIL